MIDVPLSGNSAWRNTLKNLPLPLSVENDPLLLECFESITSGGYVDVEQGVKLFQSPNISGISALADLIKKSRFGNYVYFNDNLHVNTTNICVLACRFCAFRKGPRHNDAYALSVDEYLHRIEPFSQIIDEVHSVGGLHPDWTVDYYEDLYRAAKKTYPNIHIKSLTAVEVKHIASRSGISVKETLSRLKLAGLDSLPGGGAEILVDSVRDRICRGKESSDEYLKIHEIAHGLGIKTNCTMLFGTVETVTERAVHLSRLRHQQDLSNGFQCFVPYPFLPDKTRLPEAQLASMNEIIRVISISRIMLDNIPHIKAYRMNIGSHVASIALNSGADDIDGTVNHEEIMHEAGSSARLDSDSDELARLIEDIDSVPVKRNTTYTDFTQYNRKPDGGGQNLPVAQSA
ncbi:CofH family radical SAM protein [Euryarchaeota archaeon]|jgi:aminodeoxyfutalosine synthase|nr:CofH family radical SAM protein [Euryarchaeota archaeon]